MKNLKFLLSPAYVTVTLIKSKLQIHLLNATNPDIIKIRNLLFIHYVLKM